MDEIENPLRCLHAARVPASLQPQKFGAWAIERRELLDPYSNDHGWFDSTILFHEQSVVTEDSIIGLGCIVMEDSMMELYRHLPIWVDGYGDILTTGLGLGCVVRGLLSKPSVTHIDVVEIDADIIRVVGAEFAGNPRVTIHHGDALKFSLPGRRWNFAWHDLWMRDGDDGNELQIVHAKLMGRLQNQVDKQGAWSPWRAYTNLFGPWQDWVQGGARDHMPTSDNHNRIVTLAAAVAPGLEQELYTETPEEVFKRMGLMG